MSRSITLLLAAVLSLVPALTEAATTGVYHPYVNQNEREFEYGVTWRGFGDSALTLQRASVGYGWTDNVSTEVYLLSEFPAHDNTRLRAYELEVRWQLTEQGEYASDWGLIFEAEVGAGTDRHEIAAGLLWEKELGRRWVVAANALVEYEFGAGVENEFETGFRGQLRYLHRPAFEPALELYLDDQDYAVGPAIMGMKRLAVGKQLRWDIGLLFGIGNKTPDSSLRMNLEFEF